MREGDLRLDHPKLCQVAARLGFFGAERRPKAVALADGGRSRLVVKLSRLREIGLVVEVVHFEQGRRALAGGGSEDRSIHQGEATVVEEVPAGLDDLVAHPQDRSLARRAEPEVAMVHQEFGPVLLGRDRVRVLRCDALEHLDSGNVELKPAGSALVGPYLAYNPQRRFLCQAPRLLENFGSHRALHHHALNDPGAVAKQRKQKFPAFTQVVQPTLDQDFLADVLRDIPNLDDRQQR